MQDVDLHYQTLTPTSDALIFKAFIRYKKTPNLNKNPIPPLQNTGVGLTTRSSFRLLPEDGTVCCTMPSLQDRGAQHCLYHPCHQRCPNSCHPLAAYTCNSHSPPLLRVKPQRWPRPFGTHCRVLHSLLPRSPLDHPPPVAYPSNFQELRQSKGAHVFPCPILSLPC